jgi:hypothetical protein
MEVCIAHYRHQKFFARLSKSQLSDYTAQNTGTAPVSQSRVQTCHVCATNTVEADEAFEPLELTTISEAAR